MEGKIKIFKKSKLLLKFINFISYIIVFISSDYVRGATVKLMIKELELSTKFLGATKDLTILEADCILLGLIHSPIKNVKNPSPN